MERATRGRTYRVRGFPLQDDLAGLEKGDQAKFEFSFKWRLKRAVLRLHAKVPCVIPLTNTETASHAVR